MACLAAICLAGLARPACAQFLPGPIELSGQVTLDEADSTVRANLERVKAYIAAQQWDEAVETLRQVMENFGAKMVPLTPRRYINLADYCHVQIAALPPEALALYRERVDPLAQKWYEEALARRDSARLAEVIDKMFCSSWGDDALWALGEIELERGRYAPARRAWERLIEVPPARIATNVFQAARTSADLPPEQLKLLDHWYASKTPEFFELRKDQTLDVDAAAALTRFWKTRLPLARLAYPGTDMPAADVRARLVLVSIMEGALQRAREELTAFELLHPDAEGRLAGRKVKYADALREMIASAESWPATEPSVDWPTFAGAPSRSHVAPGDFELGRRAWTPISLGEPLAADSYNSRAYSLRRIGEDSQRLLSYHPLVVGDLLLVNNQSQIFAYNANTGAPAWPGDPKRPSGEIFADENTSNIGTRISRGLGVPRFTMTAYKGRLFARMGSQVTCRPLESDNRNGNYLVCVDLEAQGRLVWKPGGKIVPDDDKWSFEGAPVVDESGVYVAMRKSDIRPHACVACFDPETGRMRWRTLVCAAETPGAGQFEEITHNLLTLEQGTLYFNSNLGAVAAISTRDGHVEWATLYPRAKKATPDEQDKRTAHFYRDLNPCIYYQGLVMVAPADCESIFALDAGSGDVVWETRLPEDAVHLLGVGHGNLLASGDTLWWIDAQHGKVVKHWPDAPSKQAKASPLPGRRAGVERASFGYGRGLLHGDKVLWTTHAELFVFDQDAQATGHPRDPIPLSERGAAGGNLVAAGGILLIATPEKLLAFRPPAKKAADEGESPQRDPNGEKQPPEKQPADSPPTEKQPPSAPAAPVSANMK